MPTLTQPREAKHPTRVQSKLDDFFGFRALSCFAFALLCATRLLGLTRNSLWYDEGYTLNLADSATFHDFLKTFSSYTLSEHLQPLYYFTIFLWSRVAGTSDTMLRLPSALFSIASGVLIYRLARSLAPQRPGVAIGSLLLFTFSSYSLYFAQEARPYDLLQFLAVALLCAWVARTKVSAAPARSLVVTLAFTLMVMLSSVASVFTAVLVLCVALADALVRRSARRWVSTWAKPLIGSLAAVSAYVLWMSHLHAFSDQPRFVILKQHLWLNLPYFGFGLIFGVTLPPGPEALHAASRWHAIFFALPILTACTASVLFLAVAIFRRTRNVQSAFPTARTLGLAALLYAVVLFAGFGYLGRLNVLPRHGSAFSGLLIVSALCGYVAVVNTAKSARQLHCAMAGVLLCNLFSCWEYAHDPAFTKDAYRDVAMLIRRDSSLPTVLVQGQQTLLRHYGAVVVDANAVAPPQLESFLDARRHDSGAVRLVTNVYRGYLWDGKGSTTSAIAGGYTCTEEARFAFMQVDRCTPRKRVR